MRCNRQILTRSVKWLLLLVCIGCLAPGKDGRGRIASADTGRGDSRANVASQARLAGNYGKIPLSFEANQGQTDARVKFLSRGPGYTLFLTGNEVTLELTGSKPGIRNSKLAIRNLKVQSATGVPGPLIPNLEPSVRVFQLHTPDSPARASAVVRMRLVGANPAAKVKGEEELPGKSNYFIDNDPKKWRTNVPTYAKVKCEGVYRGVDLVYYGNKRQLEHDFVVAPGADPSRIALDVGAGLVPARGRPQGPPLRITADGDLVVPTESGEVRLAKPLIYQEGRGGRREISGGYVLKGAREVAFEVGTYDSTKPLVIDPVLSYSTYLGGSAYDEGYGIAVDSSATPMWPA